ncbi:MAG: DUF6600 domain-containing protein, partial [Deltaproteobacteria bacterium]|nr:DUF6600 domain-containing protein [Deltaproteobacteria bacterium]
MFRIWLIGRSVGRLLAGVVAATALALAGVVDAAVDERSIQLTPPRLGLVDGDVSFWRPGAGDWETAQVNIPLAPGDALAARDGQFELQIGGQSFARGGDGTQLRLKSLEPDFVQFEVTQGSLVLDLRQQNGGHVVAIDTPNARLSTTQDGYYRVDVGEGSTRVTVRRAGAANLTPNGGHAVTVGTGEAVMIQGTGSGQLEVIAAPAFDDWDRWNYERADTVLAAPRAYTVAQEIYGGEQLEQYGSWRYVNTYGRVWVPSSVPAGWAPYTSGRWLWDPVYGYSWVDYAPWGWAPYHYGRWVYAGYWAWAPGPVVVAPVYAPALVAFYGPSISVSVGFGAPYVGWVALGWGEPLIPWWGPVGFVGTPCWWGWGGPRVVNNINIYNGDVVNADQINFYRNAAAPGGLVGVPKHQFSGFPVSKSRIDAASAAALKPWRGGALPVDGGRTLGTAGAAAGKGAMPDFSARRAAAAPAQAVPAEFTRRPSAAERGAASGGPPPLAGMPKAASAAAFDRLGARGAAGSGAATGFTRGDSGSTADFQRGGSVSKGGTNAFQRGASASKSGTGTTAFQRGGSAAKSDSTSTAFRRLGERPNGAPAGVQRGATVPRPQAKAALPPYERLRSASPSGAASAPADMRRSARRYASAEAPAFRKADGQVPGSAPSRALGSVSSPA